MRVVPDALQSRTMPDVLRSLRERIPVCPLRAAIRGERRIALLLQRAHRGAERASKVAREFIGLDCHWPPKRPFPVTHLPPFRVRSMVPTNDIRRPNGWRGDGEGSATLAPMEERAACRVRLRTGRWRTERSPLVHEIRRKFAAIRAGSQVMISRNSSMDRPSSWNTGSTAGSRSEGRPPSVSQ